jgi:hypothetical protein
MHLADPLHLLARTDKWYLGNGGMLVYAPPFPQYLGTPGFWDECHYGDLALPRLLCLSFAVTLEGGLYELDPYLSYWHWYPDRIEARHYLVIREGLGYKQQRGIRIFISETRRIGPDGTLSVQLSPDLLAECPVRSLHVVGWTARQKTALGEKHSDFKLDGHSVSYQQHAAQRPHGRGENGLPIRVRMWGSQRPLSAQVTPAHGANLKPRLVFTPLWDSLRHNPARPRLSGEVLGENPLGSVVYAGLQWVLPLKTKQPRSLTVLVNAQQVAEPSKVRRQAQGDKTAGLFEYKHTPDPGKSWREFLSLVPHFECSDEMLTRYYWYRWYGLRLNAVPRGGNYPAPAVTEGIAYFRGVITYSLMCHLQECKWLADPALAQGCLRNHIAHQTRAGHFPGHIYVSHVNSQGFYHTDVGAALSALMLHHPDSAFAAETRRPLQRLLQFYLKERDTEGLALYDVCDQFETGQEYTSRYFHADRNADQYGWVNALRLKGVDVTFYVYNLVQYLEAAAIAAGDHSEARRQQRLAQRIRESVAEYLWDVRRRFFFDYNASTRKRSPYWVAVGAYPLINELASDEQALAAAAHLADPRKFASPWPTPTVACDDPYFQSDPRWRGERANCPWNGRVWPMVNGHLLEVYARLARLNPRHYRPRLAAYLRRFVEMLHYEQEGAAGHAKDLARPNCFEHYSPSDGSACEYRGIDDYMHSEVANGILKYVAGVRLCRSDDGGTLLSVDPFPFGLKQMLLLNCRLAGQRLDVCWNRDLQGGHNRGYRVYLNRRLAFKADEPTAFSLAL